MSRWHIDAGPAVPYGIDTLTSDEILDVLSEITPDVYRAAVASLAETTPPATSGETGQEGP